LFFECIKAIVIDAPRTKYAIMWSMLKFKIESPASKPILVNGFVNKLK
jgi:hypothetical protein